MRRKLFNLAVVASLILLTAMSVTWARSYSRAHVVGVSRSVWPSADSCVYRFLSVRLVLGHWVILWGRSDYDVSRPEGVRFHHAMDLPTFRKEYSAGVRWNHFAYDVKLGPQPTITLPSATLTMNPEPYFFLVPLSHGFGRKDDPPRTHLGRTIIEHKAVAPAWPV